MKPHYGRFLSRQVPDQQYPEPIWFDNSHLHILRRQNFRILPIYSSPYFLTTRNLLESLQLWSVVFSLSFKSSSMSSRLSQSFTFLSSWLIKSHLVVKLSLNQLSISLYREVPIPYHSVSLCRYRVIFISWGHNCNAVCLMRWNMY